LVKTIAAISLVYDVSVGIALSLFRQEFQDIFGVAAPQPPIHVDLNALFVTCVGIGYILPYREPERYRGYMWIFGVLLKFASDAALAALSLAALLRNDASRVSNEERRTKN
jgi:hypothetical protein